MDEGCETLSRDQLLGEISKLRSGIQAHRDSTGHDPDLCWHQPALWSLLPEPLTANVAVPEWPQFMRGCVRYRESLDDQTPEAPRQTIEYPSVDGAMRQHRAV
jgi:hypothetical protein